MSNSLPSILLLTILLSIGLFFFLKASSKDRTTVVEIYSELNSVYIMDQICIWLKKRGWNNDDVNVDEKVIKFKGFVASSLSFAAFLSLLGSIGSACIALVIIQIFPELTWWPMLITLIGGPLTGYFYTKSARRIEELELKLIESSNQSGSKFKIRAHRDELIALDNDLSNKLKLKTEGNLFKTPI
tara:strand:+ start:6313 stop:6870 length:558 start_codon:yes stop_codon:yes gene_type:complete